MTLKPLYDRVVVRRKDAETTSQGGIIIPDSSAEKPSQGEIVAIGDGALTDSQERKPMTVSVGDQVLFGQYSGTEVKVNGESLLIMKESDIFAIVDSTQVQEKAA